MKFSKSLCATAVLGLFVASNAVAIEAPLKVRQMFGNLDPNNPGYEVLMPKFKAIDQDADGYPDKLKVSFTVYDQESGTFIRETPVKTISTPPIPAGCAANDPAKYFNFDLNIRIARREDEIKRVPGTPDTLAFQEGSHRAHMGVNMEVDCWDGAGQQESVSAALYSANLTGVVETNNPVESWVKAYPGKLIYGLQGIDTGYYSAGAFQSNTRDLVNDTLTVILTGDVGSDGTNFYVQYYESADGSTKTYQDAGTVPYPNVWSPVFR